MKQQTNDKHKRGIILIVLSYGITLGSVLVYIFKLFYPYHVAAAILIYLSNWMVFLIGAWQAQGKYLAWVKKKKMFFLITIILAMTVYLAYVFVPFNKAAFLGMTKKDLIHKTDQDLQNLYLYIEGLEGVMAAIEADKDIFNYNNFGDIPEKDKQKLLKNWAAYLDYQVALSKQIDDYKYFYQINYFFNRNLHAKAFLIGYAAYLTSYKNGIKMVDMIGTNDLIETILNDKNVGLGLAPGMYSQLKWNTLHINDVLRLTAGYGNHKYLRGAYEAAGLAAENRKLMAYIDDAYAYSTQNLKKGSAVWFPMNAINVFKEKTYTVWFPVQKNVAKQMGKIRLTSRHENFITTEQIKTMKRSMEPGDIILERRNWYTSNIGIPGFWPHVALYFGHWSEFNDYFNVPEVNEYIRSRGYSGPEEMVRDINPGFFDRYSRNEYDVYEALAPGVILNKLTESARADYVGVLRPRLDRLTKFKALIAVIPHFKKSYDYNFNFITDSELVCSELVYKAYKSFMDFELYTHVGRQIYTATEIAKKFDREFGSDVQELDFVYFLDGREKLQKAVIGSASDLRESWQRPKWELALE